MAQIPEADVFIPEAWIGCTPEEKQTYNNWIENTFIPELNHQHISYVQPCRHFPPIGDLRQNINTAVTNCTYTICCLCPAIVNKFYGTLMEAKKDKVIFFNIDNDPTTWKSWKEWNMQIIDCSNNDLVPVGVRRIRLSLDIVGNNASPTANPSAIPNIPQNTGTGVAPLQPNKTTKHTSGVVLRKPTAVRSSSETRPDINTDGSSDSSIIPVNANVLNADRCQQTPSMISERMNSTYTRASSLHDTFASMDRFNPFVVPQTERDTISTMTMTELQPAEIETTGEKRFIRVGNMMVLDSIEAANPAGGRSADDFLLSLKENSRQQELQIHYPAPYISKYVIPHACLKKDLAALVKLYAWSNDSGIKLQTMEKMKELLTVNASITNRLFGEHLVAAERVLRARLDQTHAKDMTLFMLYLEVFHLTVSLLYLAIVSGSLSPKQVEYLSDCRQHARDAVETLTNKYQQLFQIDPTHFLAHTYVIGKFYAFDVHSLQKKKTDVGVLAEQLDVLKGKALPPFQREEIMKRVTSSIKECLSDKFLRHVFFHYLVILVCVQSQLKDVLDQLAMIIADTDKGIPWSWLSLLYGYRTLCEFCTNEDVINAVTKNDSQFRRTIQTFRRQKMNMTVATTIVSPLLYHTNVDVGDVATNIFQHEDNGNLLRIAKEGIAEVCRSSIRKQGSKLGLTLEPDPVTLGEMWDHKCVVLKGKLNPNQRVYCKFPKLTKISDVQNVLRKDSDMNGTLLKEIRTLKHLQRKEDSPNVIKLVAYDAAVSTLLPYLIFTCAEPDRTVSAYLVSAVKRDKEIPLQIRVALAVDILNAVKFCNNQNVLIRHICAHAFLVTKESDRTVAKLADFSQAQTTGSGETLQYHGSKTQKEKIAVLWTAPESIFKREYTLATEVFSASLTVHEILSHGVHPYQELDIISLQEKYKQILKYRIWPERKPGEPESIFATLMESCLYNPENRPSIDHLLDSFRTFQKETIDASLETGYALLRMSTLKRRTAQHRMQALKRMLKDQPVKPEMCSLQDIQDITHQKEMWNSTDEMDDLYTLYIAGDYGTVPCTSGELQERDDPQRWPSKVKDMLLSSLILKDISEEEKTQLLLLKNPNVASVVGFALYDEQLCMLMDCKSSMTLLNLMRGSESDNRRFSYYEQIAEGMAYMHERHFIHGCLQAKFIYVTENGRAIIGQLARATLAHVDVYDNEDDDVSQAMEQPFVKPPINTIRWMSKETNESGFVTQKTDVHSFGVLLWEAENALYQPADTPINHLAPYSHVTYDQVVEVQRQRHALPQPSTCPDWLDGLIKALMANPSCRRPSFHEALGCLRHRVSHNPNVELEESAQHNSRSSRNILERFTVLIDTEDDSMGFLHRGTTYDQQTRYSQFLDNNPGYETRRAETKYQRRHVSFNDIECYDTPGNPNASGPFHRSEMYTRGATYVSDVLRPKSASTYYESNHRRKVSFSEDDGDGQEWLTSPMRDSARQSRRPSRRRTPTRSRHRNDQRVEDTTYYTRKQFTVAAGRPADKYDYGAFAGMQQLPRHTRRGPQSGRPDLYDRNDNHGGTWLLQGDRTLEPDYDDVRRPSHHTHSQASNVSAHRILRANVDDIVVRISDNENGYVTDDVYESRWSIQNDRIRKHANTRRKPQETQGGWGNQQSKGLLRTYADDDQNYDDTATARRVENKECYGGLYLREDFHIYNGKDLPDEEVYSYADIRQEEINAIVRYSDEEGSPVRHKKQATVDVESSNVYEELPHEYDGT